MADRDTKAKALADHVEALTEQEEMEVVAEPGTTVTTVQDVMEECRVRAQHVNTNRFNRKLFMNCAFVMKQMLDRIAELEGKVQVH